MMDNNFSPWPSFTKDEASAIQKVLLSNKVNYWTGDECRQFESEFASWCNVDYSIAVANGTLALELALKAINIKNGDEVIVTPRTFIASISSIVSCGGTPIFADVDENSGNITAKTIQKKITTNTKAIICVHLAGLPCEMDEIMQLSQDNSIKVIEDCAQSSWSQIQR
jgi:dTDP-4-amino-4,6-dideoxygalactose transaminase